jgi:hypothetical protein
MVTESGTLWHLTYDPNAHRLLVGGPAIAKYGACTGEDELKRKSKITSDQTLVAHMIFNGPSPTATVEADQFFLRLNSFTPVVDFDRTTPRSAIRAMIVAEAWTDFSENITRLFALAASRVSTAAERLHIVRILYEELGFGDPSQIHSNHFREAVSISLGHAAAPSSPQHWLRVPWEILETKLRTTSSDALVFGVLLGIELPAEQNIEAVFNSLAYDTKKSAELAQTDFFRIHRANEQEHIRLTVSNFKRFSGAEVSRADFFEGMEIGLEFWRMFWLQARQAIGRYPGMGAISEF